jgi:hypothetical protein
VLPKTATSEVKHELLERFGRMLITVIGGFVEMV